nr:hypothetical protein [uncultured Blautia sp.]
MSSKKKKQKVQHIPQTLQDSIPYVQVAEENGVFEIKPGEYSKSYYFPEINFRTLNNDSQLKIAQAYSTFISAFPQGTTVEVTIYNKNVDIMKFQDDIMLKMKNDGLDVYRDEYNTMLLDKLSGAKNNLETIKLLTVGIKANDMQEAFDKFNQIDGIVSENMALVTKRDSRALTTIERLDLLNTIYNHDAAISLRQKKIIQGVEVEAFSLENCRAQGITTKDVIAPSGMLVKNRDMEVGSSFTRSYYISNYPSWIKSTLLTELASLPANMLVSVYFDAIPQDEAIKMIKRQGTNISSNLLEIQKKAAKSGFDPSLVSPELQVAKEESSELMDEMTKDNGMLFTGNIVITIFASSLDELQRLEELLKAIAIKSLVFLKPLNFQQEEGFNSSLPLANNQLKVQRLMTSNTISSINPFSVREVHQKTGMYYGLNASSRNMILYDRTTDVNPNGCILGMPGAGKSFSAKREMLNILLNTDDEVYVIDPEGVDYVPLANALGGSEIKLATGSKVYLNPFDLNIENTDDNGDPVKVKTDFIETICEIAIGGKYGLSPYEKSIIDRCVVDIYEPYMEHLKKTKKTIDTEKAPTMQEFYDALMSYRLAEAQNIAISLERFVKGSLDIFAHPTNVEIDNRFTVYNIKEIGTGLKELGLQICLDNIWNKMIMNKAKGKRTWFYVDEFYLMMRSPTSASYIAEIWKRARKWNGIPTAITQNVEDMLKSEEARTIINNSTFIMLLGQTPINRQQLSEMLDISKEEQKYISTAKPGMGLLRILGDTVPMDDAFPKNTELYHLMTTKPTETV